MQQRQRDSPRSYLERRHERDHDSAAREPARPNWDTNVKRRHDAYNDRGTNHASTSGPSSSNRDDIYWQRRRRIREQNRCSPIWDTSPPPPNRLEDRFQVGADQRRRKERKRQRKEERRLRREAKKARKQAKTVPVPEKPTIDAKNPQPAPPQQQLLNPSLPDTDEEDDVIGPSLPPPKHAANLDYGKALRPGEASKMAAYVQDGARIPRRGEIGLSSEQISSFEHQGYVMSGSRNRRMEAVRIRKENQVYSAEELAALSQYSREERKLREERMLNHFRTLVQSKRGNAEHQSDDSDNDDSDKGK